MNAPGAPLRFSVIVASRGRPESLRRTLTAVRQLDHPAFEILVVGDPDALEAVAASGIEEARTIAFDRPNLSEARNIGIGASAGDVCAFIDDDAVPEPLWLRHHETALRDTGAAASVGFVRGPDGIGFQSRFETVDRTALRRGERWDGDAPGVPSVAEGRAVHLVGTNMAIRRDALIALGGFDPAYAYYLEDTDLSLRLALAGLKTAVAPLAEVHHAIAASSRRTRRRVPRSLFDIGRSTAIFARRHAGGDLDGICERLWSGERRRVERAMVRGLCEPGDVGRLLATLAAGWREGIEDELPELPTIGAITRPFVPVPPLAGGHPVRTARLFGRRRAIRAAEAEGARGTVLSYSLTSLPCAVRYSDSGIWLHTGGLFHRRGAALGRFRWCRFASRVREEAGRVAKQRGIKEVEAASGYRRNERVWRLFGAQVQRRAI